ncbi:trichohyalin-like isoform X24 [Mercenaria mercenaria]|uniref:trichohyalin-like isoform X24 n=1 Tax=Mercenaria mercenaria TaxID=6596 RepID=UPI00234E3B38|nr:trichohyalin-like isoform X24 [Mercenaria mercenaria]
MATGSALNLSLLSRGVGEVTRNGSEKVDVIFEPQDYFNFVEESHDRPFFLPPLQPRYHGFTSEPSQLSSRYSSKDAVHLPKTFTTRKGALLLFSEDMAHRTKAVEAKKHRHQGFHSDRDITLSSLEESSTDRDLKTVDDLAKSILAYGSIDESGNMNLKVMAQRTKKRRYDFERQIRPGFSAKRYLSTWTKTWDDTTLEKVISKGYLTEKSLFYYNPLLPHLSRRLNDDLSHYPTPYKLMRSMLMSPGSLSGYTFYRVRPESQETDYIDISEDEEMRSLVKSRQAGSVKVASVTADGQLKEAIYGQLDRQAQAEVLTDLLVKGAVHYAMKTQQEFAGRILEESEGGSETKVVPKFDMRDAVESMLQANEQKGVPQQMLDADLPERDDRSQHSGSFKGSKLGSHRLHPRGQGDGLQWRDDASSASSGGAAPGPLPTSHAPLPPIGQTYTQLTPIGEASREHTQAFSLPVNEKDGVPQTADSMQPQIGIIPATPQTPAYSTEAQVGVKGVSKDPTFVLEAPEEVAEAFESEDEEGEDWVGRRMVEKPVEQKTHVDGGEEKRRMEMEKRKARVSARSLDLEGIQPKQFAGPPVAAGFSSSESAGPGSTHSSGWLPPVHKQQWKGSQQSLRSHGSRRAYASDDSDAEVPNEWKLQGRQTDIKKLPKREGAGSYDLETEREVWEGLKHTSFVGRKSGMDSGAKSEQAQSVKGMSPERSKSEMKYSPKAQGLQRSHSSPPLSDRSDISGKSRSRPSSEVFKSYRPLQSQLTHLEGETQMIREQTEVSHFTEKEKSELSKQSEKADVTDLKTELTIPDHIEEEGHIEAEVLVEDLQPEVEQVEKQVEEQVEKRAEEVEKHDEEHDEKQDEEKLEKPEEEPVEKLEEEVAQTDEVERKTDEDQEIEADKSVEKKSGEITPKSLRTPSQSASVINDEDVKESPKSRVTEQEIIDKLTSHATHIAESVLSHSESGQLLEEDIRRAAALWMDTHPPRDISRSQSVQDLPDTYVGLRITRLHVMTVIQEVMKVQKRNSAGPTVAEYRDQIKGNLMTALAKATGLKQSDIPQDAEIDPELLEQLASNTLTPDDIEIVRDEETGRSFIRSRNRIITEAMGGVEKGHIYQPAAKKTVQWLNVPTSGDYTHWSRTDGEGGKRVSIPSERKPAEIGELDIITYQGQDDDKQSPKGSKAGSEVGSKKASSGKPKSVSHDGDAKSIKSAASFKDSQGQDELQKALADLEQGGSPTDAHSLKSGKSGKTQKSDDKKSKVSEKKGPSPEKEKKEEFVVGKVQNKKELEELYSQPVHAPEPKESVLAENSIVKDKKEKSMKEKSVVKKSAQSQKSKLSMASKEKTDVKVQKKPKTPATKAKPKSKPDKEPEPDKVEVKVEEPTKTEPAKEVEQKIEPNVLKEKEPPAKDVTAGTRKPKTPAKNTKPKVKIDKGHDQAEVKTETAKKVDKKIEPNVLKEEEPPFKDVTGKPKEKKQTKAAPVGKKKPEKGKKPKGKGKKKEEPAPEPETAMEAVSPVKEKTPEPPKEKTPKSQTPVSERPDNIDTSVNQSTINTSTVITESAKQESDEEEEYIIVRDETMSPEIEQPDVHLNMTTSAEEEEPDEEQPLLSTRSSRSTASSKRSEADKLRMISNREARAAKRAAAAEKRRQEVERKRKEREEQIKREKEEHERQEVLRQEQEELRKQKEEERRLKKQREEEENEEQMQEELERQRREKAEVEKERRRKEEYARKLEMMKVKQAEEEKRRQEEAERKRLEEEERRKEEEELMAKMAEEERLEYERKKKLEEEERIRKEEEEKKRREEEAQRALEEARRLAEEMARKQAELEARLRFNRSLQMEANGLEHTQDITKAFVFSYFELLQWLGLDIPEFELLKLNQY